MINYLTKQYTPQIYTVLLYSYVNDSFINQTVICSNEKLLLNICNLNNRYKTKTKYILVQLIKIQNFPCNMCKENIQNADM